MGLFRHILFVLVASLIWSIGAAYSVANEKKDPLTAWKNWQSIEAAIALRPLDGPEDIHEKVEIIEDRVDDLVREKSRQQSELDMHAKELATLYNQRAVLKELSEIRLGSNTQTRHRLHALAERIQRKEAQQGMMQKSNKELDEEIARLQSRIIQYNEKSRNLKDKEGVAP